MTIASGPPWPATLITGFLGSGKTTLLNGLLAHPAMGDTAVIVNEFGEIGLDHLLIETAFEDAVLLKSGCVCCTVRGDLVDTLASLADRRKRGEIPPFARVAIETTGLADPAPILHLLMGEPSLTPLYRLDRVVTTVDAVNALAQLDAHYEASKQAALADRLVLTKTDLVTADERARVLARLAALNPAAPVSPVVMGRIEPAMLFDDAPADSGLRQDRFAAAAHFDHEHEHDAADPDHHARHHGISTVSLVHDAPVAWPALQRWLVAVASLRGPDLLRIKGIVQVEGRAGPVVIHGVQHVFHPPVELGRWPSADRRTRITFITRNIAASQLANSFASAMAAGETGTP
jgi:G3E family GTPase